MAYRKSRGLGSSSRQSRRTPLAPESPAATNGQAFAHYLQVVKARPAEQILVFPSLLMDRPEVFSPGRFCGFRTDPLEMVTRLFPRGVTLQDFRSRDAVLEANENLRQVVVTVVPWHKESRQVWCYRRGETEGRLAGKLSCLVGGHVNLTDFGIASSLLNPPVCDLMDVLWVGAIREMGEEVVNWKGNWRTHHSDCRIIMSGVVSDEVTPVDRCHFGFVYRMDVSRLDLPVAFAKSAGQSAGWKPVDSLVDGDPETVETWTRHVARHLSEKYSIRSTSLV